MPERVFDLGQRAELMAAILLSLATVLTAWCAYQATRWGGIQSSAYATASDARLDATRAHNRAMQLVTIDAVTFLSFTDAYAQGDSAQAEFIVDRAMRPEFLPHFEAWRASNPLENSAAARNPFDEAYLAEVLAGGDDFEEEAAVALARAEEAARHVEENILGTVFFAMTLFFGGIATKFRSPRIQLSLLGFGMAVLLAGGVHLMRLS